MFNAQSNAKHLLFEIQNKLGTMMPWMTSVANKGAQTESQWNRKKYKSAQAKARYHGIQKNLELRARML